MNVQYLWAPYKKELALSFSVIGPQLASFGRKRRMISPRLPAGVSMWWYLYWDMCCQRTDHSVPGPCCDSQLDLDAMVGLSGCLNGCHSRAWHGVSLGWCCQLIRCSAVLFRDIFNPGSFSVTAALLWPLLWSVIMLPLLLLVLSLG